MKIKIIYTGIDHPNHIKALDAFAEGIKANGDEVVTTGNVDGYVIFGSWKDRDQPHHNAKREVVNSGKPFVVIETPIFGRKPVKDHISDDCFRVGLNGFLNNRGTFVPSGFTRLGFDCDTARLDMMRERLNVEVKPMRKRNSNAPIVLALQLPGDASLEGQDINQWFRTWVDKLELVEYNKICRFPQLPREYDRTILDYASDRGWNFQQGNYDNLQSTFDAARFTISYSSGFGTDSLIAGCPAVVDSDASFAYELAHHGSKDIDNLYIPEDIYRDQWLARLAYHQWFMDEMEAGLCWKHIKSMM
jgi:hypothetical protein